MFVGTNQLISTNEFQKHFDEYVHAAKEGHGPFAVAEGAEIVGFFVSAADYERMIEIAINKLLSERQTGDTISHSAVRKKIKALCNR